VRERSRRQWKRNPQLSLRACSRFTPHFQFSTKTLSTLSYAFQTPMSRPFRADLMFNRGSGETRGRHQQADQGITQIVPDSNHRPRRTGNGAKRSASCHTQTGLFNVLCLLPATVHESWDLTTRLRGTSSSAPCGFSINRAPTRQEEAFRRD
jgi:hypothetical protein